MRARCVILWHMITALIAKEIKDDCAAAFRTVFLNSTRARERNLAVLHKKALPNPLVTMSETLPSFAAAL